MRPRRALDFIRDWARRVRRDGTTLWYALRHPGTPRAVRVLAAVVVAYALSPIDLIPDFVPVLGWLDEALLLPGLIWLAIRMLPAPVLAECRARAERRIADSGSAPRTRWGIAFVVAVWAAAALLAWRGLA